MTKLDELRKQLFLELTTFGEWKQETIDETIRYASSNEYKKELLSQFLITDDADFVMMRTDRAVLATGKLGIERWNEGINKQIQNLDNDKEL